MTARVKIVIDPYEDVYLVLITREIIKEDGQILRYFLTSEFKWVEKTPNINIQESIPRIHQEDFPMLAELYKELHRVCNFKEVVETPIAKELSAVQEHLNDMRVIVFKQLGIDTE